MFVLIYLYFLVDIWVLVPPSTETMICITSGRQNSAQNKELTAQLYFKYFLSDKVVLKVRIQ